MGGRSISGVSGPSGVVRSTIFKRPELSSSSNCDKIFAIFFYSFQFRNLGPGLLSHRFQATPELEAVLEKRQIHVKRLWSDCLDFCDNRCQRVALQRLRHAFLMPSV